MSWAKLELFMLRQGASWANPGNKNGHILIPRVEKNEEFWESENVKLEFFRRGITMWPFSYLELEQDAPWRTVRNSSLPKT